MEDEQVTGALVGYYIHASLAQAVLQGSKDGMTNLEDM